MRLPSISRPLSGAFALGLSLVVAAAWLAHAAALSVSSTDITQHTRSYGSPTTCTLTATADTYVRRDQASSSFGAQTTLDISSSASATRRTLVQFDLSGCSPAIPSDAIVSAANVRLTTAGLATTATRSYVLHRATSSLSETTTWSGQPTVAGSATWTTSVPVLTAIGTVVTWSAAADVQAFVAGSATNFGWRLADTAEDGNIVSTVSISFSSREAASNRPQLVITYRP